VSNTDSPGLALYKILKTWPHWKNCYMSSCWVNFTNHLFIIYNAEFYDKVSLWVTFEERNIRQLAQVVLFYF
jgi:beta-glucosidase/6-phospho-beta-glucosidase/beta-galactosidase